MNFAPHEQRVIDEHRELTVRVNKLAAFFGTQLFAGLPEADRSLLRAQHGCMTAYAAILDARVNRFVEAHVAAG